MNMRINGIKATNIKTKVREFVARNLTLSEAETWLVMNKSSFVKTHNKFRIATTHAND
jgi:hypothetical protein